MKKFIILAVFLINSFTLFSQSLSLFDVDASAFPTMKAKFFAFDKDAVLQRPTIGELSLSENTNIRTITNVSCPSPMPAIPLSSVLVIDVSLSMEINSDSNIRMDIAKKAASTWINWLDFSTSECAITSFDTYNYINSDFSQNKSELENAINTLKPFGGTDYNSAFINEKAGALLISKNAKNKKVIVFITDGQGTGDETKIINEAKNQNCQIFCVTIGMYAPDILRNIAKQTGGLTFENVNTLEAAEAVYKKILYLSQFKNEPCEITWTSQNSCNNEQSNIELKWNNITSNNQYSKPVNTISDIQIIPNYIYFGPKILNKQYDTTITLKARNSDFNISNIQVSSGSNMYSINGITFPIKIPKNTSKTFQLKYEPKDSSVHYSAFKISTDLCDFSFSANGGYKFKKNSKPTLKLTNPNANENYIVGNDTLITWEGIANSDTVKLEYSIDNGKNWKNLIDTATNLKYTWKNIPKPTSNQCLVKVKQKAVQDNNNDYAWKSIVPGNMSAWSPDGNFYAFNSKNNVSIISSQSNSVFKIIHGDSLSYFDNYYGNLNSISVTAFAFNNKSTEIAVAYSKNQNSENLIKIWDIASGKLIKTIVSSAGEVNVMKYSPDDEILFCLGGFFSFDFQFWVFKANGWFTGLPSTNKTIAISPDGQYLINSNLMLYSLVTGKLIKIFSSLQVSSLNFSSDGTKIVAGGYDGRIKVWDTSNVNAIATLIGHKNQVTNVSFNQDNTQILSSSLDSTVKIWDYKNDKILNNISGFNNSVICANYNNNFSKILTSTNNEIKVWDSGKLNEISNLSGHTMKVYRLDISKDNNFIASASFDNTVKIWDVNTGIPIKNLIGHTNAITDVKFSPDGKTIASCAFDNAIKIWDLNSSTCIKTLLGHNRGIYRIDFSKNASKIASAASDSSSKIWDIASGNVILTLRDNNTQLKTGDMECVKFISNDTKIATGMSSGSIIIWNLSFGGYIETILNGHTSRIQNLVLSPDGTKLASSSSDKTIKIWDLQTNKEITNLNYHTRTVRQIEFNQIGDKLISASDDRKIVIWNFNTSKIEKLLLDSNEMFEAVTFIPNSNKIVAGSINGSLTLWDFEESILQEDQSDKVFSIVAPSPLSRDINMNQVELGKFKDSTISNFVENKNLVKFQIDSIYFRGQNANAFNLVSLNFPKVITSNDIFSQEIRFNPTQLGINKAEIVILSKSDTLIQNIVGEAVQNQLEIVNQIIDFGRVKLQNPKDSLQVATIKNIGSSDIVIDKIRHYGPNDVDFTTLSNVNSVNLPAGQVLNLDLRFLPKSLGRTSGRLLLDYNGIGSPALVQLFGEAFEIKKFAAISSSNLTIPNLTCTTQKDTILEIKNEGLDTLKLKSYKIQGTNPNEFKLNQDISNLIVLPDSVLKVPFSFTPYSSGSKSADLIIESNAIPDSVYVLKLQAFQDSVNIALNIKQIDLGILCPNTSKDTLISLENFGTLETGFDIVYDKDLSSSNSKTTLLTKEKYDLAIKFDGLANEGTFSRKVKITDKICGKEEIVDLVGTIEDTKIQTTIEILKAKIGQTDQKALTIYNKSNHPINIASEPNIAPFTFVSSYFPLTINKNDSAKLQVSYLFVDKLEKKVNVSLSAEPCNANTNFELKAQSGSNPKAKITTNVYSAYPGDIIEIPIMISDTSDLNESKSKSLTVDLTFNSTLLEPIGDTPIGSLSEDKKLRTIPLVLPTKADINGILGIFKFKVGLGNDSTTKLDLTNQISDSNDVELTADPGVFNLLGICRAAGPRLINPNGEVKLSLIRPNPVGDNGELDIETIENGQTELYIVNLKGEKVATLYQGELAAGKQTLIISTKYLSNGTYFVILQTPTVTQKVKMEVVK